VLRRLCITVRRRAITLTYYFEAAGSQRPGGIMVLVFLCVACVVCCVVHEVFLMCAACVVCCVVQHEVQLVKFFDYVLELVCRWFDGFETHFIRRV
jgi:hypothetical protein